MTERAARSHGIRSHNLRHATGNLVPRTPGDDITTTLGVTVHIGRNDHLLGIGLRNLRGPRSQRADRSGRSEGIAVALPVVKTHDGEPTHLTEIGRAGIVVKGRQSRTDRTCAESHIRRIFSMSCSRGYPLPFPHSKLTPIPQLYKFNSPYGCPSPADGIHPCIRPQPPSHKHPSTHPRCHRACCP